MTAATTDRQFEASFRTKRTYDCRVDLVKFLQTMTEQQREQYRRIDLSEFGYDDESERPLAYLCGFLDDRADAGIWQSDEARGIVAAFADVETELDTPKDYSDDDLFAAVPWLAPEVAMDPEALARIPGPHDVPLFELPGATR